jgi:ABC-type siderophore export system fused ATPase/permease subunit
MKGNLSFDHRLYSAKVACGTLLAGLSHSLTRQELKQEEAAMKRISVALVLLLILAVSTSVQDLGVAAGSSV